MSRQDVYKGNSVQHWHNKAKAYGDAIMKIHDLLPWGEKDVVEKVKDFAKKAQDNYEVALENESTLEQLKQEKLELEAKLDYLKKISHYKYPSYGYHNGGIDIHIQISGEEDCPKDFDKAIEKAMRGQDK